MEDEKKLWRGIVNAALFLGVMALTFYAVLYGQDPKRIWQSLSQISPLSLLLAAALGVFFVSAEGCMIWYLLRAIGGRSGLFRCIAYSFIGFFYSGITPSASGGQPVQLYYMRKDGNALSHSSVVLMTVAVIYKFVLVVIGLSMLLFWSKSLRAHLGGYFGLYLLGLSLNLLLVVVLVCVMAAPMRIRGLVRSVESFCTRRRLLKPSEERLRKIDGFIDGYRDALGFLWKHPVSVAWVVLFTFVQRFSVFLLAYVVYWGFGLTGTDLLTIVLLQASVYIAVDMLPVPGAQGITEWMYAGAFAEVYPSAFLMPSLYVTRGISFYFLLLLSLLVMGVVTIRNRRKRTGENGR